MRQLFFDYYNDSNSSKNIYDNFIIHSENKIAFEALKNFFSVGNFNNHPFKNIILQGESCSGKTHLIKFLANKLDPKTKLNIVNFDKLILNQNYLNNPLKFFKEDEFFVIDDVFLAQDEEKLLQIINCASEAKSMLILITRQTNIFNLQDLNSRLKNIYTTKILNTNSQNLKLIFANILSRKQMFLEGEIMEYIFDKVPLKYSEMIYAIKKIEFFCGENDKKLTLKNIKEIF